MPLHRRIPKRGFHNPFAQRVRHRECRDAQHLSRRATWSRPNSLARARPAPRSARRPIKILGDGELKTALTVRAHAFSKSAEEKITARRRQSRAAVMNQFFEAFANMFRIPDLRKRILFTLAMLAVYRLGAFLPTPGINTDVLSAALPAESGLGAGHHRPVQRRQFPPADHLRAGHHALHHRLDHPAADDGGLALPRALAERRRAGPAQDHAVHALPDDPAQHRAVAVDCLHLAAPGGAQRRISSGL